MLIEFRLKNYKSFKDEAALSLIASSDKTHHENLLSCPDDTSLRILNSAVIYGANASGKSSLFEAFEFAKELVRISAKNSPGDIINVRPFVLDEKSKSEASKFEFVFIQQNVRYQYGFSVTRKAVQEEWLITYPKGRPRKLFERKLEKENNKKTKTHRTYSYKFSAFLKGEKDKLIELTHPSALFLSVGATFNNPQLVKVFKWFEEMTDYVGSGDLVEPQVFKYLAENSALTSNIEKLVKFADLGIEDYALTESDISKTELPENAPDSMKKLIEALQLVIEESEKTSSLINKKMYRARMVHRAGDKLIPLPWDDESDGTRRLFGMSAPIFDAINGGKVIFIDEIDRSLHPLLVKELVMLFQNKKFNPKNAQLVFNTHDTSLLGTGAFRRDQIWFLEKDQNANSHLYSLLEFSPRKDEALEKGYLQGRYGAVPFLGDYPFGEN
jgi:uncharacterized protein